MQEFGSVWTEAKLDAIEKYLNYYTTALKKQHFKLCYIDAFAGSGSIKIKSGDEIEGSAVRALKYPFDKFHFLEQSQSIIEALKRKINELLEHKDVEFHNEDCNSFLLEIDKKDWMNDNWRGVIFLDPYAMDLEWECLSKISATKIFDVWYFFPFMAVNRNLKKNRKILPANRNRLNRIIGTSDWENIIYSDSPQLSMFDEKTYIKENVDTIQQFIINRLEETFPTVSKKAVLLRNERNSPQFLLCFAGSNPSKAASKLSLNIDDSILTQLSNLREENGT
jgi:three-Cys-motif partner protein